MISDIKKFLNEEQDIKTVEKISVKLVELLMSGEEVEYIAVQKKPAVNISPDSVVLTNKRIIFFKPKTLGLSMEFEDFVWKEILDCHMKESFFGAEFTVKTTNGIETKIEYLPKAQARKLYTIAQEQEERQLEFRRQLDLEEKRAAAGNINVSTPNHQPNAEVQSNTVSDPLATLQKLKSLLDNQLIEPYEYEAKKAEILKRM